MALIIGMDLGRKSAHDIVIPRRETAQPLGRSFRIRSTVEGLQQLVTRLQQVAQPGEEIAFVMDAPGKAWIPLATVLQQRGYPLYRPSAHRVRRLRQAGHRKDKSNRLDALTLARCLLLYPKDTSPIFLPQKEQAQLDQVVRQRDRLVDSHRRRLQRIQDLCEPINPGLTQAAGSFLKTEAGRAFLRQYLDPETVVRLGKQRLADFLQRRYRLTLSPPILGAIFQACQQAVALYQPVRDAGLMPFDPALLQEEMNWELDQLEREEQRLRHLEQQIIQLNQQLDPHQVLISLPGVHHLLAAGIRTCVGHLDRFSTLTQHRGFAGLYPSTRKTGDSAASSTPLCKMSCNRYKRYLYLAAENAYKWDVDGAAFYHKRRQRGHTHTQAVCAVANAELLTAYPSPAQAAPTGPNPRPASAPLCLSGPVGKSDQQGRSAGDHPGQVGPRQICQKRTCYGLENVS